MWKRVFKLVISDTCTVQLRVNVNNADQVPRQPQMCDLQQCSLVPDVCLRLFHTRAATARSLRQSQVRGTAKWLLVADRRVTGHWLNALNTSM